MEKSKEELLMEWYEQYYEDVYRFVFFMLNDKQSCGDLVHDTFIRAYTAFDRFDGRSSIKTWLFSIAKYTVIDEIRRRKRRSLFGVIPLENEIASAFNIEQHVENKEMVLQLIETIHELKPNYRLVIIINKIEEFSTKETAVILNWSETKVRKTLSRAMLALKGKMENKGGEYFERLQ